MTVTRIIRKEFCSLNTSVNDFSPFLGQPVRSAQTFLREIANKYEEMPTVIPDGIYGEQTEASVKWFQNFRGLPVTGVIDKRTWDTLLEDYLILLSEREPPVCVNLLPKDFGVILPNEENSYLHSIQAIMKNLSSKFDTVSDLDITGIHDEASVNSVKSLQRILGREETGNIDKAFWNDLAAIYETHLLDFGLLPIITESIS